MTQPTAGQMFASLRQRRGFTQAELVAAMRPVKCRVQTISDFESGRTIRMRPDRWVRIAEVLGVSVAELDFRVHVRVSFIELNPIVPPKGRTKFQRGVRSPAFRERSDQFIRLMRGGGFSLQELTLDEIDDLLAHLLAERERRGFPPLGDLAPLFKIVETRMNRRPPKPFAGHLPIIDD